MAMFGGNSYENVFIYLFFMLVFLIAKCLLSESEYLIEIWPEPGCYSG